MQELRIIEHASTDAIGYSELEIYALDADGAVQRSIKVSSVDQSIERLKKQHRAGFIMQLRLDGFSIHKQN